MSSSVITPISHRQGLPVVILICAILLLGLTVLVTLGIDLPGDTQMLQAAMSVRNETVTVVISVVTFLGSAVPSLVLCTALSLIEMRRIAIALPRVASRYKQRRLSLAVYLSGAWPLAAMLFVIVVNILMRLVIHRLPPQVDYLEQLLPEPRAFFQQFSFPSGHAGTVIVAYLSLLLVMWPLPRARIAACILSAAIIVGVGFGRLYLGVHWPSDVLAGFLLGFLSIKTTRYLRSICVPGIINQKYGFRTDLA